MKNFIYQMLTVCTILTFINPSIVYAQSSRTTDTQIKELTKHTIHYSSNITYNPDASIPKEIVLVMDTSESMRNSISGNSLTNRINTAKSVAIDFVTRFYNTNTKIGLVSFSSKTRTQGLVDMNDTNKALNALKNSIVKLSMNKGTNIAEALSDAETLLNNGSTSEKYIILLTDGEPSVYLDHGKVIWDSNKALSKTIEAGNNISKNNINSYVVGFTNDISVNSLEVISNSLNTNYVIANSISDIFATYQKIATDIKLPTVTAKYREILPIEVRTVESPNSNIIIKKEVIDGIERYIAEGIFEIHPNDNGTYNSDINFDLIVSYHYKYSNINYNTNTLNIYNGSNNVQQCTFNPINVKVKHVIDVN